MIHVIINNHLLSRNLLAIAIDIAQQDSNRDSKNSTLSTRQQQKQQ